MKEEFLHYIWRTLQFETQNLIANSGEPIQIVKAGQYNTHSGADFLNAHIIIDDTLWIGNVEMHLKSSDWYAHQHQQDRAYDNVILHVVWEDDAIITQSGRKITCLSIDRYVDNKILEKFESLNFFKHNFIPCESFWKDKTPPFLNLWMESWLIERLMRKVNDLLIKADQNKYHWEEVLYTQLATALGTTLNAVPMRNLLDITPYTLLLKYANNKLQLEALLLGQAGFLQDELNDQHQYSKSLQNEYDFLRNKHKLQPMNVASWKFFRTRPASFPTIRIVQLASILHNHPNLMSVVVEKVDDLKYLTSVFNTNLDEFWLEYLSPTKKRKTKASQISLGKATIHSMIINAIAPTLYAYAKHISDEHLEENAIKLLEALPAEDNIIVRNWLHLGIKMDSAYQTQSMIQLYNNYCKQQKCMDCQICHFWIKKS